MYNRCRAQVAERVDAKTCHAGIRQGSYAAAYRVRIPVLCLREDVGGEIGMTKAEKVVRMVQAVNAIVFIISAYAIPVGLVLWAWIDWGWKISIAGTGMAVICIFSHYVLEEIKDKIEG